MSDFTPFASLVGGVLIGLSASAMLLLDGKITGISGIVAGLLRPIGGETGWRACFVAGLFAGGLLLRLVLPGVSPSVSSDPGRRLSSQAYWSDSGPDWETDAPAVTAYAA